MVHIQNFPNLSQILFYGFFFKLKSMRAHALCLIVMPLLTLTLQKSPHIDFLHDTHIFKRLGQLPSEICAFWICLMVSWWCHLTVSRITCVSFHLDVRTRSLFRFKLRVVFARYLNGDAECSTFLQKEHSVRLLCDN